MLSQTRDGYRFERLKTDASGRFAFDHLAAGAFEITTSSAGFLEGAVGKRRPHGEAVWLALGPGERRDDLTIEMFREASIAGRVTDERGQPLTDLWVEVWLRSRATSSVGVSRPAYFARTVAGGTYRISGIPPGEYVAVVPVDRTTLRQAAPGISACSMIEPPPPAPFGTPGPARVALAELERPIGTLYTRLSRGLRQPAPLPDGTPATYRTTFFPGVHTLAEATSFALAEGDVRAGYDFQLRPVPGVTVAGRLTSRRTLRVSEVRLKLPGDPRGSREAQTWVREDGTFTLLDVPVGHYLFEPTRVASSACDVQTLEFDSQLTQVPIDVPAAGLRDLVVPLVEGAVVTGSMFLQGSSRRGQVELRLVPFVPQRSNFPPHGEIERGRFTFRGVLPGRYELRASESSLDPIWSLGSVTAGGRDVTGMSLVVGPEGLSDVIVALTDRPASVTGTILGADGRVVRDATVVLFPADRASWAWAAPRSLQFRAARTLTGIYRFSDVLPGEYFIAALDETNMDAWPSADLLQRTSTGASKIDVRPASAQVRTLMMR